MNIQAYLTRQKGRVDAALKGYFQEATGIPPSLLKAMQYSLVAGGKRIRSILAIASCEAVGGGVEAVLPVACALECIHTFSLIHDDLPAMDNDDLRRGKPTSHKIFGEGMAILAGDGLLAEAFTWISQPSLRKKVAPEVILEVLRDVAIATGARGMVGGQVLDLEAEGHSLQEEALAEIHRYKTGALISVSVTSGAKVGGARGDSLRILQQYGEKIGLAFQITDDILNVEGKEERVGKSVGSDRANRKSTYPQILGLEGAKRKSVELVADAVEWLSSFGERGAVLRGIANYIVERQQ